jgi:hypothetical protein
LQLAHPGCHAGGGAARGVQALVGSPPRLSCVKPATDWCAG